MDRQSERCPHLCILCGEEQNQRCRPEGGNTGSGSKYTARKESCGVVNPGTTFLLSLHPQVII